MAAPVAFVVFGVLVKAAIVLTYMNVDELNTISYHVDILNNPVRSGQESSGSVMQITSRYGQEYRCNLPEIPYLYDDETIRRNGGDQSTDPADLSLLLKPMETSPCLTKTKDWWTYEFCYGKHIKQYHLEDNKIVSPVIILGLYESEYNWHNETKGGENSRNKLRRYHSQYYVNGSTCDVTGTQRRSEVRFVCEDGSGDYIHHVDEPESCRYIVTIHTTKVCHHPFLRPPPNNKAHSISCQPVLTSEQYEKYLRNEEEKTMAVEEKRKTWLAKQEQLLALKQLKDAAKLKEIRESASEEDTGYQEKEKPRLDEETIMTGKADSKEESISGDDFQTTDAVKNPSEDMKKNIYTDDVRELEVLSEKWRSLREDIEGKMKEVEAQMRKFKFKSIDGEHAMENNILKRLKSILENLLEQVNKAELDTKKASDGLLNLQDYIDSVLNDDEENNEVVTQKTEMEMEPGIEENNDDFDYDTSAEKLSNKISDLLKVIKRKENEDSNEDYNEDQHEDETLSEIEKVLFEKMRASGIDIRERKLEVKIITSGFYDEDEHQEANGEHDPGEFSTVMIQLIGEDNEMAEHLQHQGMLEKNYRFVWDGGDNDEDKKKQNEKE